MASFVALLSDFGAKDWFVASMKAVVLRHAPDATLVDITHEVPPGDVRAAAFILSQCWHEFPPGTVFLAVVDPGVGTDRAGLVLNLRERLFVGPDNGILSVLTLGEGRDKPLVRRLENPDWRPPEPSPTFHGRDVFAPAAGILSTGASWTKSGPLQSKTVLLPWNQPKIGKKEAVGEIIHFDHYGNAITNLHVRKLLKLNNLYSAKVVIGQQRLSIRETYGNVPAGHALAYFGSTGLLEIAANQQNARQRLALNLGEAVKIELTS